MSNFFDTVEEECVSAYAKFKCIKNHKVIGYAGSYVELEILFLLNEHIYLAEKMAGNDFDEYLDYMLRRVKQIAMDFNPRGNKGHHIVIDHKWIEED